LVLRRFAQSPGFQEKWRACCLDDKAIFRKEYPHFLREGAAKPRPLSKNEDILSQKSPKIVRQEPDLLE